MSCVDFLVVVILAFDRDKRFGVEEPLEKCVGCFVRAFKRGAEVEFDVIFVGLGALRRVEPPVRAIGQDAPVQLPLAQGGDEFRGPEAADGFVVEVRAGSTR